MEKKLKKISKKVNYYLNSYLSKSNSSELIVPMKYGLFPEERRSDQKLSLMLVKSLMLTRQNLINISCLS